MPFAYHLSLPYNLKLSLEFLIDHYQVISIAKEYCIIHSRYMHLEKKDFTSPRAGQGMMEAYLGIRTQVETGKT